MQRGTYVLRVFTSNADDRPIGVVALGNVNREFQTANIWVVLGDKSCAGQGYASLATSRMLTVGFQELGLKAIHTWIVEHNPSIHVARRVGFRPIGRQRLCHCIDGRAYDRLWFDLLASEHEELRGDRSDGLHERIARLFAMNCTSMSPPWIPISSTPHPRLAGLRRTPPATERGLGITTSVDDLESTTSARSCASRHS